MSGFGVYETLRILVPGWFVAAFLNAGTRLAFGATPVDLPADVAAFTQLLENPLANLGVALVAGLLLYAMDLPTKAGVYLVGDPDNGKEPPSRHLRRMLTNDELKDRSLSLYFLLQDEFMHQATHRKVYLFGSLYRIFVDLRVLAAISLVAFVIVGSSSAPIRQVPFAPTAWLLLLAAVWLAPYAYDWGQHAINSVRKHEDSLGDFLSRRRAELSLWPLVVFMLLVNALAAAFVRLGGALLLLGVAMAVVGVGVWLRAELGGSTEKRWAGIWWWIASRAGAPSQRIFTSHQRAFFDVATYLPWVVVASILTPGTDEGGPWVLAWLAFLLPLSLVLGFHKHEDRLRNSYGDQNMWLDLHSAEIEEVDRQGRFPVTWWNSADQAPLK